MAADQAQFQQLLSSLLSTDNDVRQQAEDAYNELPRAVKVTHLLGSIHNGQQAEDHRQMAAVLLRRLFTSEFLDFYKEVNTRYCIAYIAKRFDLNVVNI
ncbi:importin-5-like [Teleopsis dalmanni]|uniref:importin-5-like n=1 Tax=Teleopsis dalmanni TaxID=139649 RepID=UPI0018CE692A|nr:importin-5-like [Teleopsis dalmanni]XP_037944289.1 importin-5-like [Teleopsis dalmanni]